jgi:hypothetical protein
MSAPAAALARAIRTAFEDHTWLTELPGYRDEGQKVRYRIVPAGW